MRLLDVNMPRRVASLLGEFGISAHSAEDRGWNGLTNGALVEAAVQEGFKCILTRDRLFSESAGRTPKRFPDFCVVLILIPQLRGPDFLTHFRNESERSRIQPVGGRLLRWPENPIQPAIRS